MPPSTRAWPAVLALILGATCLAAPYWQEGGKSSDQQKQSDKNKKKSSDNNKDKNKKKDANDDSPFGPGKINVLKSSQKADAASAGFNGLTPNGEVEAKKLKEPATADDFNKAEQVSFLGVKASSLRRFIQDGKLNTAPPKTETASPKKG